MLLGKRFEAFIKASPVAVTRVGGLTPVCQAAYAGEWRHGREIRTLDGAVRATKEAARWQNGSG